MSTLAWRTYQFWVQESWFSSKRELRVMSARPRLQPLARSAASLASWSGVRMVEWLGWVNPLRQPV